ncbi:hypothetical protein C1I98_38755, partial [Spongiactinospora gelatinilytica]
YRGAGGSGLLTARGEQGLRFGLLGPERRPPLTRATERGTTRHRTGLTGLPERVGRHGTGPARHRTVSAGRRGVLADGPGSGGEGL